MSEKQLSVCAQWTDDCQGKKDYDGRIVELSSRFWPANYSTSGNKICSAYSSINLMYGHDNAQQLVSRNFEGESEAAVKYQVEVWAKEQFDKINAAMQELFK